MRISEVTVVFITIKLNIMKLSVHWTDNMPSKTKEVNKNEKERFVIIFTYVIVTILL